MKRGVQIKRWLEYYYMHFVRSQVLQWKFQYRNVLCQYAHRRILFLHCDWLEIIPHLFSCKIFRVKSSEWMMYVFLKNSWMWSHHRLLLWNHTLYCDVIDSMVTFLHLWDANRIWLIYLWGSEHDYILLYN